MSDHESDPEGSAAESVASDDVPSTVVFGLADLLSAPTRVPPRLYEDQTPGIRVPRDLERPSTDVLAKLQATSLKWAPVFDWLRSLGTSLSIEVMTSSRTNRQRKKVAWETIYFLYKFSAAAAPVRFDPWVWIRDAPDDPDADYVVSMPTAAEVASPDFGDKADSWPFQAWLQPDTIKDYVICHAASTGSSKDRLDKFRLVLEATGASAAPCPPPGATTAAAATPAAALPLVSEPTLGATTTSSSCCCSGDGVPPAEYAGLLPCGACAAAVCRACFRPVTTIGRAWLEPGAPASGSPVAYAGCTCGQRSKAGGAAHRQPPARAMEQAAVRAWGSVRAAVGGSAAAATANTRLAGAATSDAAAPGAAVACDVDAEAAAAPQSAVDVDEPLMVGDDVDMPRPTAQSGDDVVIIPVDGGRTEHPDDASPRTKWAAVPDDLSAAWADVYEPVELGLLPLGALYDAARAMLNDGVRWEADDRSVAAADQMTESAAISEAMSEEWNDRFGHGIRSALAHACGGHGDSAERWAVDSNLHGFRLRRWNRAAGSCLPLNDRRRSAAAESRHLTIRVLLQASVGIEVGLTGWGAAVKGAPVRSKWLRVLGSSFAYWNVLMGSVDLGDDLVAVHSDAIRPRGEAESAGDDIVRGAHGYAVELYFYMERTKGNKRRTPGPGIPNMLTRATGATFAVAMAKAWQDSEAEDDSEAAGRAKPARKLTRWALVAELLRQAKSAPRALLVDVIINPSRQTRAVFVIQSGGRVCVPWAVKAAIDGVSRMMVIREATCDVKRCAVPIRLTASPALPLPATPAPPAKRTAVGRAATAAVEPRTKSSAKSRRPAPPSATATGRAVGRRVLSRRSRSSSSASGGGGIRSEEVADVVAAVQRLSGQLSEVLPKAIAAGVAAAVPAAGPATAAPPPQKVPRLDHAFKSGGKFVAKIMTSATKSANKADLLKTLAMKVKSKDASKHFGRLAESYAGSTSSSSSSSSSSSGSSSSDSSSKSKRRKKRSKHCRLTEVK